MRPSFIATGISAILIIIAIIWFIMKWNNMSDFEKINIFVLICIFIAIHAIAHYIEEIYYGFNPLIGKWQVLSEPTKRIT